MDNPTLDEPVPSHAWVEVTHCALAQHKKAFFGLKPDSMPAWAYVSHGSGVSVNVGNTAIIDERPAEGTSTDPAVGAAMFTALMTCVDTVAGLGPRAARPTPLPFAQLRASFLKRSNVDASVRPAAPSSMRIPPVLPRCRRKTRG